MPENTIIICITFKQYSRQILKKTQQNLVQWLHATATATKCRRSEIVRLCGSDKSRYCNGWQRHRKSAAAAAAVDLRALTADATGQLDVLGHDGDTLGVDGAQVGVLEQADQVGLARLLQGQHGASSGSADRSWSPERSREPGAGRAACGSAARCSSGSDGFRGEPPCRAGIGGLLHAASGRCALAAALVASCLRGALPPVDLRAVCLVRAISQICRASGSRTDNKSSNASIITRQTASRRYIRTMRSTHTHTACRSALAFTGVELTGHWSNGPVLREHTRYGVR